MSNIFFKMLNDIDRSVSRLNESLGRLTAWLLVAMVGLTLYDVAMRYLFNSGSIAVQELEWHLFGIIILFGASYTLKHDDHVRVDLVYSSAKLTHRHRAIIDVVGTFIFLLPFSALIIWASIPFAYDAYLHAEMSPDPGGLRHRWLLKAAIPLGFALLALQAVANAFRALNSLSRDT
ncbi:MAG: TRAP-type mannitol/chloroaromatic compound transport system permease small subunit [Gammaproteobacteria bacterium]|jgi:TRAP-type mannitol/chloroaromatic compound transport system permease small subunit